MGTRKKFTPEELKHLRANPYTLRVTPDSISYTLAFKEAFWALSLQGYTGTAAFRKLGCNAEVLGLERVRSAHSAGSQASGRAPQGCPGRHAPTSYTGQIRPAPCCALY